MHGTITKPFIYSKQLLCENKRSRKTLSTQLAHGLLQHAGVGAGAVAVTAAGLAMVVQVAAALRGILLLSQALVGRAGPLLAAVAVVVAMAQALLVQTPQGRAGQAGLTILSQAQQTVARLAAARAA
jgi:hypothetical protein